MFFLIIVPCSLLRSSFPQIWVIVLPVGSLIHRKVEKLLLFFSKKKPPNKTSNNHFLSLQHGFPFVMGKHANRWHYLFLYRHFVWFFLACQRTQQRQFLASNCGELIVGNVGLSLSIYCVMQSVDPTNCQCCLLLTSILFCPRTDPHANNPTRSFNGWVIMQQSVTLLNEGCFMM